MESKFQNIYFSNKRKSFMNNIFPINDHKRERFHYTPSKNEPNGLYNEISDIKNSNKYNYIQSNDEQKDKDSYDTESDKDDYINEEEDNRKNLYNDYFRYNTSGSKPSNINNDNYINLYKNNNNNNNREYLTKKRSSNHRYSIVHRIYEDNNSYKPKYESNSNIIMPKQDKSYNFNNYKNTKMEFNDERLKRQMKHDDRRSKISLKFYENKNDIINYNPNNIRKNYDNNSSTAFKREYVHYDVNYPKNNYLNDRIQLTKNNEHDEPILKKTEENNLLTRSKSNHFFRASFIQVSDKKDEPQISNYNINNYNIDRIQLFKDLPDNSKNKFDNENTDYNYLKNKEQNQNINNNVSYDYKKNKIIETNFKYEPKFRQNYQNNTRNDYNYGLSEYNPNTYQSNINSYRNNLYLNNMNKPIEKYEVNKSSNFNNNNNSRPVITKELRKREEINNKYRNIEKNRINEKNVNKNTNNTKDNKNNQYPVKVIIQRKDENKNNEHKPSEDHKKNSIYYQKKDNISIVNSINITPNKNNEIRQKYESSNKYNNHKLSIRSMSEPNLNPIAKSNYDGKLNSKDNKYNNKTTQPENKVTHYINATNNNNSSKNILEQYKKEKIYEDPFINKRKSQFIYSSVTEGRYFSPNKRSSEYIRIEKYSPVKKESDNNQYRNRNSKIDFNLKKNINNTNNNNDILNKRNILDEKSTELIQKYTPSKYVSYINTDISKKMIDPIIKENNNKNKSQYALNNNYIKNNNNNINNSSNQNKLFNSQNNHQLINNKRNSNLVENNDKRAKSPEIQNINSRNIIINNTGLSNFQRNNYMANKNSINNNQNNIIYQVNKNQNQFDNNKNYINIRSNTNQLNNNNPINNNNQQMSNIINNTNQNNNKQLINSNYNKYMSINKNISSTQFQSNNNLNDINIKKGDINRSSNFSSQKQNNNININYNLNSNKTNYVQSNQNSNISQTNQNSIINKYNLKKTYSSPNIRRNSETLITKNSANGLQNIGATCYMNATLQCLAHVEKLTKYLLGKKTELKTDKNNHKLSNSYLEVLENIWENDTIKDYAPNNFKEIISNMNPLFKGVQANDSKDLVIFLLENMHKELNKVIKNNNQNSREEKADQYNFYNSLTVFIKYFKKNFQSIFSDIFYGMYDSQMKCLNCQIITHNIQLYNILIIPLEEVRKFKNRFENIVTINECLEYYERPEYMSGQNQIFCNKCKQMANSVNSTSLIVGPKVLIINFNRGKGLQYDVNIDFDENIDINPFIYYKNAPCNYQLIGVVTHFGPSSMSGHFIAFCKSFVDNNWYKYNDSLVSLSNFEEAKSTGVPYILFYSLIE